MSKSMWIPTENDNLPQHHDARTSVDVLFWQDGSMFPCWGYYNFHANTWFSISNNSIARVPVKYFAYIDNPYK